MSRRLVALRVGLVGAIVAGLAACGPSKVAQCNSLSTVTNKLKPATEKLETSSKGYEKRFQAASEKKDPGQVQSIFKEFAGSTRDLEKEVSGLSNELSGVSLQDETLVGFKSQYTQTLSAYNKEIGNLASALETMSKSKLDTPEGLAEFQKAGESTTAYDQKMRDLAKQETETVGKFNTYCGATK